MDLRNKQPGECIWVVHNWTPDTYLCSSATTAATAFNSTLDREAWLVDTCTCIWGTCTYMHTHTCTFALTNTHTQYIHHHVHVLTLFPPRPLQASQMTFFCTTSLDVFPLYRSSRVTWWEGQVMGGEDKNYQSQRQGKARQLHPNTAVFSQGKMSCLR